MNKEVRKKYFEKVILKLNMVSVQIDFGEPCQTPNMSMQHFCDENTALFGERVPPWPSHHHGKDVKQSVQAQLLMTT